MHDLDNEKIITILWGFSSIKELKDHQFVDVGDT